MKTGLNSTFTVVVSALTAFSPLNNKVAAQQIAAVDPEPVSVGVPTLKNPSAHDMTEAFSENADSTAGNETENKSTASLAVTREGGAGKAESYSIQNDIIAVYISAGTDPAVRNQYIAGVRNMFLSSKLTDQPAEIAVFYLDSVLERGALMSVYISGNEEVRSARVKELAAKVDDLTADFYRRKESQRIVTNDVQPN